MSLSDVVGRPQLRRSLESIAGAVSCPSSCPLNRSTRYPLSRRARSSATIFEYRRGDAMPPSTLCCLPLTCTTIAWFRGVEVGRPCVRGPGRCPCLPFRAGPRAEVQVDPGEQCGVGGSCLVDRKVPAVGSEEKLLGGDRVGARSTGLAGYPRRGCRRSGSTGRSYRRPRRSRPAHRRSGHRVHVAAWEGPSVARRVHSAVARQQGRQGVTHSTRSSC